MINSNIQQELKAIIDACQSSLAVFVEDSNKIVKINQAKSEGLYTDPKSMNYQSLRDAGISCLEEIKLVSGQYTQNIAVIPDSQVKEILKNVQEDIFSTL